MDRVDCVVIGAGVIGLAVARELAISGRDVVVIESENVVGSGTSSRNSEVIHAGIYYSPGSLKASLCVEGREVLYGYCKERGVPHQQCGKLIVAQSEQQHDKLRGIAARAHANGVNNLRWMSRDEAIGVEPALECTAALYSPSTGIVDSHALMLQLLGDAERSGATIAFASEVVGGRLNGQGMVLDVEANGVKTSIHAKLLVNAAGLSAPRVAGMLQGFPSKLIPKPLFAKGSYFNLTGRSPFSRLIYPIPEPGGLGIHLTLDLGGQARFGPDVEWLDIERSADINFNVDSQLIDVFYESVRGYWPGLPDGALQPGYAGVRPKISREADVDFKIQGPAEHCVPGLVNLFGIESPGLTASLAIARYVRNQLMENE
ncbi:NAD(P)/FAD-dependent oxidoreductase [Acidovorax sp. JG5]|uniref:NAD(P)/FAD-dependent oxidoreductase n=1 Tax=Acidovorax sp. JG5 TaxID=2822718 RepID=UPI001B33ED25|nr:NAD(P)/FAD-dependent oxidoreductase [Acidovorax sp. JG5]MBP3982387.1 NAD(P)/FAD-dependent oxidoreductase [Acidovorax sp. JG5]